MKYVEYNEYARERESNESGKRDRDRETETEKNCNNPFMTRSNTPQSDNHQIDR